MSGTSSGNRAVQTPLRWALWVALALSSYWALRLAWADHLSTGAELAGRERAVQLAPAAVFAERVADRREELEGDSLPDLRRAAALDPENPDRFMRLGVRAELAGDYPLAERSLLAAAARSRLYQPKYLLAQYYFRRQDAGRFWPWARAALEEAYGDAAPIFELGWRLRPDAAWLSANLVPKQRDMVRQYLAYLIQRERWPAAAAEALEMVHAAEAADRPVLLAYCEARLLRGDGREAAEIWNGMCLRHLLAYEPLDLAAGNLVTNGDFLETPSNLGFDWRPIEQRGVSVSTVRGSFRVAFTGYQAERCAVAWQYVPTTPGSRYRLRCDVQATEDAAARAIAWDVYDSGVEVPLDPATGFVAANSLARVVLIYQRPAGSSRLDGAVSVTRVRLERAP